MQDDLEIDEYVKQSKRILNHTKIYCLLMNPDTSNELRFVFYGKSFQKLMNLINVSQPEDKMDYVSVSYVNHLDDKYYCKIDKQIKLRKSRQIIKNQKHYNIIFPLNVSNNIVLGRNSLLQLFKYIGDIEKEKFKSKILANEQFEDFIFNFTKKSLIKKENEEAYLKYDLFHRIKKDFNGHIFTNKILSKPVSSLKILNEVNELIIKGEYLDSIAKRLNHVGPDGDDVVRIKFLKRVAYNNEDDNEIFDDITENQNKSLITKSQEIKKAVSFAPTPLMSNLNTINNDEKQLQSIHDSKNPSKNVSSNQIKNIKTVSTINQDLNIAEMLKLTKKKKEELALYYYIDDKEVEGEIIPHKISPFDKNIKNVNFDSKSFLSTSLFNGLIETIKDSNSNYEVLLIFGRTFYYRKINKNTKILKLTNDDERKLMLDTLDVEVRIDNKQEQPNKCKSVNFNYLSKSNSSKYDSFLPEAKYLIKQLNFHHNEDPMLFEASKKNITEISNVFLCFNEKLDFESIIKSKIFFFPGRFGVRKVLEIEEANNSKFQYFDEYEEIQEYVDTDYFSLNQFEDSDIGKIKTTLNRGILKTTRISKNNQMEIVDNRDNRAYYEDYLNYTEIPYLLFAEEDNKHEIEFKRTRVVVEDFNKYIKFNKILKSFEFREVEYKSFEKRLFFIGKIKYSNFFFCSENTNFERFIRKHSYEVVFSEVDQDLDLNELFQKEEEESKMDKENLGIKFNENNEDNLNNDDDGLNLEEDEDEEGDEFIIPKHYIILEQTINFENEIYNKIELIKANKKLLEDEEAVLEHDNEENNLSKEFDEEENTAKILPIPIDYVLISKKILVICPPQEYLSITDKYADLESSENTKRNDASKCVTSKSLLNVPTFKNLPLSNVLSTNLSRFILVYSFFKKVDFNKGIIIDSVLTYELVEEYDHNLSNQHEKELIVDHLPLEAIESLKYNIRTAHYSNNLQKQRMSYDPQYQIVNDTNTRQSRLSCLAQEKIKNKQLSLNLNQETTLAESPITKLSNYKDNEIASKVPVFMINSKLVLKNCIINNDKSPRINDKELTQTGILYNINTENINNSDAEGSYSNKNNKQTLNRNKKYLKITDTLNLYKSSENNDISFALNDWESNNDNTIICKETNALEKNKYITNLLWNGLPLSPKKHQTINLIQPHESTHMSKTQNIKNKEEIHSKASLALKSMIIQEKLKNINSYKNEFKIPFIKKEDDIKMIEKHDILENNSKLNKKGSVIDRLKLINNKSIGSYDSKYSSISSKLELLKLQLKK